MDTQDMNRLTAVEAALRAWDLADLADDFARVVQDTTEVNDESR